MPNSDYWYLATPYSKWRDGLDDAAVQAHKVAWMLMSTKQICVFSPIAHTHPIAKTNNIDPLDHSIWLPLDEPMMLNSTGLIIAMLEGWKESYGIAEEIKIFGKMKKPILYFNPTTNAFDV